MAALARLEIVLVVTGRIAPLDIGLGTGSKIACRRRHWVWLMTIIALWNSLRLFRIMRHVPVWSDLLTAWRRIAGTGRGELIERPVTIQANVL
jgi:hypothetical protein